MSIRGGLERISSEYLAAKDEEYTKHPIATFVRDTFPKVVQKSLELSPELFLLKGSSGNGRWAEVPWFAILDNRVTHSTQSEYYVAVLFSSDMKKVFLTLSQGVTVVKAELPKKWKRALEERNNLICRRIPEFKEYFPLTGSINLNAAGNLAKSYEYSVAFYKEYSLDCLPDDDVIKTDFNNMLKLYDELTFRGGLDWIESPNEEAERGRKLEIEERKEYRLHKRAEGRVNSKKVKAIHGEICQACGFDFKKKYGDLGAGFIEAHHLQPFNKLKNKGTRKLNLKEDFAVLCANCHRMIHKSDTPHDLAKFKEELILQN
jgi:5-methylcytosine-specific restriction protein A